MSDCVDEYVLMLNQVQSIIRLAPMWVER